MIYRKTFSLMIYRKTFRKVGPRLLFENTIFVPIFRLFVQVIWAPGFYWRPGMYETRLLLEDVW